MEEFGKSVTPQPVLERQEKCGSPESPFFLELHSLKGAEVCDPRVYSPDHSSPSFFRRTQSHIQLTYRLYWHLQDSGPISTTQL